MVEWLQEVQAMPNMLFAGAIAAISPLPECSVQILAVSLVAATEDEARQLLLQHALEKWPRATGYAQHVVTLVTITEWQMRQVRSTGSK